MSSNNHRGRNSNGVQFGRRARGFVLDDGEFIIPGGHYYPQGLQSAPEEPSSPVSMYEEAQNFRVAGGRYMLVGGSVIGNPFSTPHISHAQSQPYIRPTNTNIFTRGQEPPYPVNDLDSRPEYNAFWNPNSSARQQEPSDNLPRDYEVDETPQKSPVDDIPTSSSSAPFVAAHSSAHSTIDSATEPIALSTPEAATPNTTHHIANILEVPRDTSQNMNLFHLKDTADKDILLLYRPDKRHALYKIIQSEIQYGEMDGIPYSFLAFRLNVGKDEKQVLRVELKGEFIRIPDGIVNVKGIRCLQEEKEELAKATVQVTSTKWGRVLRRMSGKPATFTTGQNVVHDFDDIKGTFDVTLSLDKRLEKEMSVLKHACFFMMLKLGKERQPMELGLKLAVTYRPKFGSRKTLEESINVTYSGKISDDITKIPSLLDNATLAAD